MTELNLAVIIDGKTYTRADLEGLSRDPELRNLARWIKANERPNTSGSWIGSVASKTDLVDYCMGAIVSSQSVKGDGNFVTRGSNDLSTLSASQNGNGKTDAASLMLQAVQAIAEQSAQSVDVDMLEERIECAKNGLREEFDELVKLLTVREVNITVNGEAAVSAQGLRHCNFDDLLADVMAFEATGQNAKANFWLVGEAGTGKTTAAEKIAEALGRPFYFNGAIDSEYKLRGFIDAQGRVISTPFRQAYETGGVYLFDEVDSSLPSACLAFNAALANGCYDFPGAEKPIKRHPECVVLAASNTWNGPTGEYVGRFRQDAAFMDRFMRVGWETDEKLERELCQRKDWHDFIIAARGNVRKHGLQHLISPRATFNGDIMLAAGRPWARAVDLCVRKGLNAEDWAKVTSGLN
jgi:AAA domain (dynein-related subfamily)